MKKETPIGNLFVELVVQMIASWISWLALNHGSHDLFGWPVNHVPYWPLFAVILGMTLSLKILRLLALGK